MARIRSYREIVHADRKAVEEMSAGLSYEERELLEKAAAEHRQGTPSIQSLYVDGKTGEITSPNGDFDDERVADFKRLRGEIRTRYGLTA